VLGDAVGSGDSEDANDDDAAADSADREAGEEGAALDVDTTPVSVAAAVDGAIDVVASCLSSKTCRPVTETAQRAWSMHSPSFILEDRVGESRVLVVQHGQLYL
jgi:hypothetical protein